MLGSDVIILTIDQARSILEATGFNKMGLKEMKEMPVEHFRICDHIKDMIRMHEKIERTISSMDL